MVLGYLYIFLSIFDDLFSKIIMKAREKMKSNNKPTSRFLCFFELLYCGINQAFLTFMKLFASMEGINHQRYLVADSFTGSAN